MSEQNVAALRRALEVARAKPAGRTYVSWKPESARGRAARLGEIERLEKELRDAERALADATRRGEANGGD